MNQDIQVPPQGSPEYDQFMRQQFGDNYEYGFRATFGIRFAAFAIDFFIIFIITSLLGYLLGYYSEFIEKGFSAFMNPQFSKEIGKNLAPINLVITIIYIAIEVSMATSIGKMILGLKIGSFNREEAEISQLIIRTSLKHFSIIFMIIPLVIKEMTASSEMVIGYLNSAYGILFFISCLFAFGMKRQTVHDMIAKTAVYKKSNILINE